MEKNFSIIDQNSCKVFKLDFNLFINNDNEHEFLKYFYINIKNEYKNLNIYKKIDSMVYNDMHMDINFLSEHLIVIYNKYENFKSNSLLLEKLHYNYFTNYFLTYNNNYAESLSELVIIYFA